MFVKQEICFLILSSVIIYLGIDYSIAINQIEKYGIKTKGKIIVYKRDRKGYQTPTINFTTNDGKIIEKEPYYFAATDFNKFKNFTKDEGKEINVMYYKNNPEKFVIDGETFFNKITIGFMMFIGLILFIVGILSLFGVIEMNFIK